MLRTGIIQTSHKQQERRYRKRSSRSLRKISTCIGESNSNTELKTRDIQLTVSLHRTATFKNWAHDARWEIRFLSFLAPRPYDFRQFWSLKTKEKRNKKGGTHARFEPVFSKCLQTLSFSLPIACLTLHLKYDDNGKKNKCRYTTLRHCERARKWRRSLHRYISAHCQTQVKLHAR